MLLHLTLYLSFLTLKGLVSAGSNTPPHVSYKRDWSLVENEPIGSVVDRIEVEDDDEDHVHLTLGDPSFRGHQVIERGFSFFKIDPDRRVILAKSLAGLAGKSFLVGIRATDGGIPLRFDVRVTVRKPNEREKRIRSGLGLQRSFTPGPPPPIPKINNSPIGPPLLFIDPFTVWPLPENTPEGTFVQKVEANSLDGGPIKYDLQPSDLVSIDANTGEVTVVGSLLGKVGDHTLNVTVSNGIPITGDVILRVFSKSASNSLGTEEKSTPYPRWTAPRTNEDANPPFTVVEKVTPDGNSSVKKNPEIVWMIVLTVLLPVVIIPLLGLLVCRWWKKHKATSTTKEGAVSYVKKRESLSTLDYSPSAPDPPKEGILGDIISLVRFHKRAEHNSYEGDIKKPRVSSRESSSCKLTSKISFENDGWEFPRHKLRFVCILGEGCFGQVWKCEVNGMNGAGENKNLVAVKTLKESSGAEEQKDLLQEMKVLKALGHHPNVVSLLGCCTEKDPIFLILEYMSEGKLQSYLRSSRADSFYGNLHGKSSTLTPKDLTIFALQIAKGMDFLSKNKIVHRDLAARNVLVGDDKICKVADFGFARDIATNHVYERKSDGRMPIRWMAPESLHDNLFTPKSDVWSFGILLWEIVTLGSTPYPGMSAAEVMRKVKEGYRLEKPDHCRREIYNIMYYCWDADPQDRPTFAELVQNLDSLIMTEVEYIRLDNFHNRTYYNFTSTQASGELL